MGGQSSPEQRAAAKLARAKRDEEIVRLAIAGHTYETIGRKFGLTPQGAHGVVKRGLQALTKKRDLAAEELRSRHIALLDEAIAVAHEIMNKDHLAHSNGRVIRVDREREDGSTVLVDVLDDGPRLAAADRLRTLSESQRKLLGLDAPAKQEIEQSGTVNYVINATAEELDEL